MKSKLNANGCVAALAMLLASTSQAVVVNPGDVAALPGTSLAANPALAGTVIADSVINFGVYFPDPVQPGGFVQERVVRRADSTLDFYWRVVVTAGQGAITDFYLNNFGATVIDANWRSDSPDVVPAPFVARGTGAQSQDLQFYLLDGGSGVLSGSSSKYFFLHTEATNFARNTGFSLGSSGFSTVLDNNMTYGPAAAVPEPSGYGLMVMGVAGLLALRHRRVA